LKLIQICKHCPNLIVSVHATDSKNLWVTKQERCGEIYKASRGDRSVHLLVVHYNNKCSSLLQFFGDCSAWRVLRIYTIIFTYHGKCSYCMILLFISRAFHHNYFYLKYHTAKSRKQLNNGSLGTRKHIRGMRAGLNSICMHTLSHLIGLILSRINC